MSSLRVVVESCCTSSSYSSNLLFRHGAWAARTPPPPFRKQHYHRTPRCSFHTSKPTPQQFTSSPPKPPSTPPKSSPSTSLSEQFRSLMRLTPHSVVVCTSFHHSKPRAMTMSSFTSLSLHPSPTISFNIATPSRTLDAVESSRRFNIHILSDDSHGARIADWLARGRNQGEGQVFGRLKEESGCELLQGNESSPVLKGDGVLYVLRCRVLDEEVNKGLVRVRDHVIVLGEVMEILRGREGNDFGLVYADRTYRRLGGCIIPGRIIDAEEEGQEG
ncbi:flavin reductase-like protein [Podospora fimiseda]|uniref:Flavin reductase-like protein n=1 Tax=Podospora fimiseda TaxID=252190 RepID=A0AAN6YQ90_9PEZI|nr:flavin reductase-like protein [Podospora fimiseda]